MSFSLAFKIAQDHKTLRIKEGKFLWHWIWNDFLGYDTKGTDNKGKNRYIGLYQNLKLLHIKGHNPQSQKATQQEKTIANLVSDKGLISEYMEN